MTRHWTGNCVSRRARQFGEGELRLKVERCTAEYVGDDLYARIECTGTRASRSKPDRGIVTLNFRIYNADDVTVLTYIDTVMFARRPAAQ